MENNGIKTSKESLISWGGGGGGGNPIYELYRVCAAVKGMVFKQFSLG